MNYRELHDLVQLRAQQGYTLQGQASRERNSIKRAKLQNQADQMIAASQVAAGILGEPITDREKEERIKAIFLHVICNN